MTEIEELFADIRNKLTPCKVVLEQLHSNKLPPTNIVNAAIEDLEKIEDALDSHLIRLKKGES